ncbi:hypothetical protein QTP88_017696 [Uroleucon formosanum]
MLYLVKVDRFKNTLTLNCSIQHIGTIRFTTVVRLKLSGGRVRESLIYTRTPSCKYMSGFGESDVLKRVATCDGPLNYHDKIYPKNHDKYDNRLKLLVHIYVLGYRVDWLWNLYCQCFSNPTKT